MICTKCGNTIKQGETFCSSCVTPVNINNNQTNNSNNKLLITLIIILLIITIITFILIFLNKNNIVNNNVNIKTHNSNTIMIYMVGSNLEFDSGIATADLESINSSTIDLDNNNILVYTGGTKKWLNNYISNEENTIFELTKDGYKKIQTYEKLNMGDPNTFSSFINYVYDNYKTDDYDLIIYDHGGALEGAVYDDFTDDVLTLNDFKVALSNTKFNKDNKLESVIFRTCLNGTLEVANIFKDYADYLIASEEVSWGSPMLPILNSLNDIDGTADAKVLSTHWIERYKVMMSEMNILNTYPYTYSFIDLSKIDELDEELNKFIQGVDLKTYYNNISKLRANMYQFGMNSNRFDTIDLYDLVNNLSKYSTVSPDKFNEIYSSTILNFTTNLGDDIHGLSVYFPYKGNYKINKIYLNVYNDLNEMSEYSSFIKKFNSIKTGSSSFSMDLSNNKVEKNSSNEIEVQLTQDQIKNYSSAEYIIYRRVKDHPNYYTPIYLSNDAVIDKNGILRTNISNNMVKIHDNRTNEEDYIFVTRRINGDATQLSTTAIGLDKDNDIFNYSGRTDQDFSVPGTIFIKDDGTNLTPTNLAVISYNDKANGTIYPIDKFETIDYTNGQYKILDENGNYLENIESAGVLEINEVHKDEYSMIRSSLDSDAEYYCKFVIHDINDNKYALKLMKVGN